MEFPGEGECGKSRSPPSWQGDGPRPVQSPPIPQTTVRWEGGSVAEPCPRGCECLGVNSCEQQRCWCPGWRRLARKEVGRVRSVRGRPWARPLLLGQEAELRVHGGLRLPP